MFSLANKRSGMIFNGTLDEYAKRISSAIGGGTSSTTTPQISRAMQHNAVWSSTNFISSTMATLPIKLMKEGSRGPERFSGRSPAYKVLKRAANNHMTTYRWHQMITAQALLTGGGYSYIERDGEGHPKAYWPLPARATTPFVSETGDLQFRTTVKGRSVTLMNLDVIHIPGFGWDGLSGQSVLEFAREAINLGLNSEEFGSRLFSDGVIPSIILRHPLELSDGAFDRLKKQIANTQGGLANAHKPFILEEGMEVDKLTMTPEESQFLQTRGKNRAEIAGWFGLPPVFIGDFERATWSNAEQMDLFLAKYTLAPWTRRWEEELNVKLLTERQRDQGLYYQLPMQALLRGDNKARAEFYKTMMQGIMTGNEIRHLEELPSLPGLDVPFVPLNMGGTPKDEPKDKTEESDNEE